MQDLSKYTKKSHIEIHTKYVSLVTVGSVALVGLVFALGVLVGSRRVDQSPCVSTDPLSALDKQSGEPTPEYPQPPVQLSFHDSLASKPDTVPIPASLLAKTPDRATGGMRTTLTADRGALETPRHQEPAHLERVPNDVPGIFSLQVGSFQKHREAARMVERLTRAGHTAFLVSVNMPERGGLWFRVRVGPFGSKQEAWQYKKKFETDEKLPAFVVKRKRG